MNRWSEMTGRARWDAPFWALLILGILLAGSLGCFGLAAAARSAPADDAEILSTDHCPPPAQL